MLTWYGHIVTTGQHGDMSLYCKVDGCISGIVCSSCSFPCTQFTMEQDVSSSWLSALPDQELQPNLRSVCSRASGGWLRFSLPPRLLPPWWHCFTGLLATAPHDRRVPNSWGCESAMCGALCRWLSWNSGGSWSWCAVNDEVT